MPTKYPEEFKRDVVAVRRTNGLSQDEIVRDFGISTHSVQRWLKQADIDDGAAEGTTSSEQQELAVLNRRNRVREQHRLGVVLPGTRPIEVQEWSHIARRQASKSRQPLLAVESGDQCLPVRIRIE